MSRRRPRAGEVGATNATAPSSARRCAALSLTLVTVGVAACSDGGREHVPWPEDMSVLISRKPPDYQGRASFVRFINNAAADVTVTRVELSSARFDDITWTGEETFDKAWDMTFDLPHGECGADIETEVSISYSTDDGPTRTSRTPVEDQYNSIRSTLDRDCAEATLREAAEVRVGKGRVEGRGQDSVYVLPLSFTPTGTRDDVTFRGIGETVLFNHVAGSAPDTAATKIALGGDPVRVQVRLQPARCDLHGLMEGARGTYFPLLVEAPGLGAGGWFYLPLDNRDRGQMMEYFSDKCGL